MHSELNLKRMENLADLAIFLSQALNLNLNSKTANPKGLSLFYFHEYGHLLLEKSVYASKKESEDVLISQRNGYFTISYLTFSERLAKFRFNSLEDPKDPLLRKIAECLKSEKEEAEKGYKKMIFEGHHYQFIDHAQGFLNFIVKEFKEPTLIGFSEKSRPLN